MTWKHACWYAVSKSSLAGVQAVDLDFKQAFLISSLVSLNSAR